MKFWNTKRTKNYEYYGAWEEKLVKRTLLNAHTLCFEVISSHFLLVFEVLIRNLNMWVCLPLFINVSVKHRFY